MVHNIFEGMALFMVLQPCFNRQVKRRYKACVFSAQKETKALGEKNPKGKSRCELWFYELYQT